MKLKWILIIMLFAFVLFITTTSETAEALPSDFSYYKLITINSSQVDETLSGFPVLLANTSDDFKDTNNGGFIQPDADDIEFWSADRTTEYPYEIDLYDGTIGKIVFWVNVSNVSSSFDSVFWMYYGDTNAIANENPTAVWDENYLAVWHMDGESCTAVDDSTANGYDVTAGCPSNCVFNQSTLVGTGVDMNNDAFGIGDQAVFSFTDGANNDYAFTFESIFRKYDTDENTIFSRYSADDREYYMECLTTNKLRLLLYDESTDNYLYRESTSTLATNVYYFGATAYDGSETVAGIRIFVNSTNVSGAGTKQAGYAGMEDKTGGTNIGWRTGPHFFDGIIDEFRVSLNISRNDSWLNASSNTILNNESFVTFGGEAALGVITYNATNVEETSATLRGAAWLGQSNNICGFWIGNESTSQALVDAGVITNITAGMYPEGSLFTKTTIGTVTLNSGDYYYVRAWASNANANLFNISENETYFLTKPNAPSGLTVVSNNATTITLSWTRAYPMAVNNSTVIYYKTGGFPASVGDGTLGYNDTASSTTISGLVFDTTYYFSAWAYCNASGSPAHHKFSSGFATASGATTGGTYNVTVRYENESISGNCVVNLSHWRIHEFIIHYTSGTDFIRFDNGVCTSTVAGVFIYNETGNFTIDTNQTITFIEFHWNGSVDATIRCYRVQVVDAGQRNITFYIRTNLPVYGEGVTRDFHADSATITNHSASLTITTSNTMDELYGVFIYNISVYPMWETVSASNYTLGTNQVTIDSGILNNKTTMAKIEYYTYVTVSGVTGPLENTLIHYTYYFKDSTLRGYFEGAGANDAWTEIYWFNSTNVKLVIHKEYWSANNEIYPMLIYNKKYRMGVGCSAITIPLIGNAPTGATVNPDAIVIPDPGNMSLTFFDIIDITAGWNGPGNGFWVFYQDTLYGTSSVTFHVWDYNGTMIYNETSDQDFKNFTYAGAGNIFYYNWTITTNHSSFTENVTIQAPMPPGMTPISDITSINDLLDTILGNTPLRNINPSDPLGRFGATVPHANVLVAIIFFILIASFGYFNAYVGCIASGLWLAFSYGAITGIPVGYLFAGVFLIAMAIVFALGGKFR